MSKGIKVAFISTFASHYRLKLFRTLAKKYDIDYYFFITSQYHTKEDIKHLSIHKGHNFWYLSISKIVAALLKGKYDVIIKCTNNKWSFLGSLLAAKLTRAKFIVWHSTWYYPMTLQYKFFAGFLVWTLKRLVNSIVVYGEHGKKFLIEQGIDANKIFIAWQTADNEVFGTKIDNQAIIDTKKMHEIKKDNKIILYVGRLVELKGLKYLLRALESINSDAFTFVAIGHGELSGYVKKYCDEKNIDYCLTGLIPYHDLPIFYKMATLLVLPSITTSTCKEPWGLVINEAFNQGCPVVVTDAVGAGVGGLVKNGVNGFVVPERNSEALSAAINKILSDETLQQSLSRNALEEIKKWTYERQAKGFIDAIEYSLTK